MTLLPRCFCCMAILIAVPTGVTSYNFDVDNIIVYESAAESSKGNRGSYSGFSVALWNPGNRGLEQSWIYIGSPRANSTSYRGIKEPGTVWQCTIGKTCKEWVMDGTRNYGPVDGSWLGGSLEVEDTSDANIVVCAPRWQKGWSEHWYTTGMCYTAGVRNLSYGQEIRGTPLPITTGSYLSRHVMGETGFSIHSVPDSHLITLGSPGMQGAEGWPVQYSSKEKRFVIPSSGFGYLLNIFAYGGYAVTSGRYFSKSNRISVAGAPRTANLYGQVVFFTFPQTSTLPIKHILSLNGEQAGEYFGSALASCDINGDGLDDLLVGAPQWTDELDEGRVYIIQGNSKNLKISGYLNGEKIRGRFGTAITCLGDIDYDGYADVAVGTPYADDGYVYIYHGSEQSLRLTQTIAAPKDTKGFGISISKPRDVDNNKFADIAVGAYLSGHVALFRSKQTVNTSVVLSADLEKSLSKSAGSFSLRVCSSYGGTHAPQNLSVIKELRIDENRQRAKVIIDGKSLGIYEYNETLELRNLPSCNTITITVKSGISNFLEPLTFSVIQRLATSNRNGTMLVKKNGVSGTDSFDSLSTIMNERRSSSRHNIKVPFATNCGVDNICRTNLKLKMVNDLNVDNKFVIDSVPYIRINISISNIGNSAYLAQVLFDIPSIIHVSMYPQSYTCESAVIDSEKIRRITCTAGNPLEENEPKTLSFELDVSSVKSNTRELRLNATAITQSTDAAKGDHKDETVIKCVPETDIGIIRKATMDRYSYTLKTEEERLPNVTFQHIYGVKNYEATLITVALFSVSIPTHWIDDGNEIEIVRLHEPQGELGGQEIFCDEAQSDYKSTNYDATTNTKWLIGNNRSTMSGSMINEKFEIINKKVFASSPDNRTLYINCTNPSIKWKTINCRLNTFRSAQSVARLTLTFDLLLANFTPEIIGEKDIIFFATNGSVSIVEQPLETKDNEPNLIMIGTVFIEMQQETKLPGWVIPVAILVGLLLLVLAIIALFKFGFFKRDKQSELRALLQAKDNMPVETAPGNSVNIEN